VFRIGIHLGDVVEESDGDLMGIAEPGAICLSERAYWQVKGRLEIAVTDFGPTGRLTLESMRDLRMHLRAGTPKTFLAFHVFKASSLSKAIDDGSAATRRIAALLFRDLDGGLHVSRDCQTDCPTKLSASESEGLRRDLEELFARCPSPVWRASRAGWRAARSRSAGTMV
jgi:hypothetical protein